MKQSVRNTFAGPLPTARDALAPVIACGFVLVNLAIDGKTEPDPQRILDVVGYALAAAAIGAFVVRRTHPTWCMTVAFSMTALYGTAGYPQHPGMAAVFVALYYGVLEGNRSVTLIVGLALGLAAVVVATTSDSNMLTRLGAAVIVVSPLAPVLVAMTVRGYRRRADEMEDRMTLIAQARSADAERLLAQQRLAIARDLHDTVAHSVAVVSIQSGAALHVLDTDPAAARVALIAINEACRQVLAETKLALVSLRDDDAPPMPTIENVLATARDAGLAVEMTRTGPIDAVPASALDVCGRIAREALTNTLRHTDATTVFIALDVDDSAVSIAFSDNGPVLAPGGVTPGNGLLGMAERVRAVGGNFAATPGNTSGLRLDVSIPFDLGATQQP